MARSQRLPSDYPLVPLAATSTAPYTDVPAAPIPLGRAGGSSDAVGGSLWGDLVSAHSRLAAAAAAAGVGLPAALLDPLPPQRAAHGRGARTGAAAGAPSPPPPARSPRSSGTSGTRSSLPTGMAAAAMSADSRARETLRKVAALKATLGGGGSPAGTGSGMPSTPAATPSDDGDGDAEYVDFSGPRRGR